VSGEREDLKDLAAAFALGALAPEEARAFEAFLATSPEAQREVAEYREVNALLAAGLPTGTEGPAPELRARVLARVARDKVRPIHPASPGRRWLPWAVAAAAAVAAVALGLRVNTLDRALADRDASLTSLRSDLAAREARLAEREATLNAIMEPAVRLTTLTSTGGPAPGVQLFMNPETSIAIAHAFHLEPAAAGRVYQLWFIPKGGKPIPSVTFNSEPTGHALVERIAIPRGVVLSAAAVTNEPAGGSPQPTTAPFLVGTLGS
jgi:anti-sigma-K factor RskA